MNSDVQAVINAFGVDVTSLDDDELQGLLAGLETLAVKVRNEQGVRRRNRRDQRLLHSMTARASCVFCRRTYLADTIAAHVIGDHHTELATWRRPRRRRAAA